MTHIGDSSTTSWSYATDANGTQPTTTTLDFTSPLDIQASANDAAFDSRLRIGMLYGMITTGCFGLAWLSVWLKANKRKPSSRLHTMISCLALADAGVMVGAMLPQLLWEYNRQWNAGQTACKLLKLVQSYVIMASTNTMLVLSYDRYRAIVTPMKQSTSILRMVAFAWLLAVFCSCPQLLVFHVNKVTAQGPFRGKIVCESWFRQRPSYERQAYLVYVGVVLFYLPCMLLWYFYTSIFITITRKIRRESSDSKTFVRRSCGRGNLPLARLNSLKTTLAVGATFVVCALPYNVLEMLYAFGPRGVGVPGRLASILGAMPVANSAVNAYVFLAFNWKRKASR